MSNQEMNEALRNQEKPGMGGMNGSPGEMPSTNQNTRRELEGLLEGNLGLALQVLSLVRTVGDSLFGPKPSEVGEKESTETASSFFNRTKDVAMKTRNRLNEVRDELNDILKEIK